MHARARTHVRTRTRRQARAQARVDERTHARMHARTHARMHTQARKRTYTRAHAHRHARMLTRTYNEHMHAHASKHAHKQTHRHAWKLSDPGFLHPSKTNSGLCWSRLAGSDYGAIGSPFNLNASSVDDMLGDAAAREQRLPLGLGAGLGTGVGHCGRTDRLLRQAHPKAPLLLLVGLPPELPCVVGTNVRLAHNSVETFHKLPLGNMDVLF